MEKIDTDFYGSVSAPESLSELWDYIGQSSPNRLLWRGQSKINWPLHSTAVRRILNAVETRGESFTALKISEANLRVYEKDLVCNAEKRGYRRYDKGYRRYEGKMLNDLELLALLQHHGAATRLMDFTRNMMIALWFATEREKHMSDYGLLIGIEYGTPIDMTDKAEWTVMSIGQIVDWANERPEFGLMREYGGDHLVWEPPPMFSRILVQDSHFVFSRVVDKAYGSLAFDASKALVVAASPELKQQLNGLWKPVFNYSPQKLFPDIEGFASFNNASISIRKASNL